MRRYAVWHSSEPGFETEAEAKSWIAMQANPLDYRVVATDDDYVPDCAGERYRVAERERDVQRRIDAAVQAERDRIIARPLGLSKGE